ncbi:MAG: hypothetical protein LBH75_00795 [Treponema sp.]|jgi:hypothetical protein|nr:hypothetical protein [Treponema sp.]
MPNGDALYTNEANPEKRQSHHAASRYAAAIATYQRQRTATLKAVKAGRFREDLSLLRLYVLKDIPSRFLRRPSLSATGCPNTCSRKPSLCKKQENAILMQLCKEGILEKLIKGKME